VHVDLFDVLLVPFQKCYASSSEQDVLSHHKGKQSVERPCVQMTEMFMSPQKILQCNFLFFSGVPSMWLDVNLCLSQINSNPFSLSKKEKKPIPVCCLREVLNSLPIPYLSHDVAALTINCEVNLGLLG
jgi:hypothetical protein